MPYTNREMQRANDRARHARQTEEQRQEKNRKQRERNAALRADGTLPRKPRKKPGPKPAVKPAPPTPPQSTGRKKGTDPRPILRQTADYFRFSATERDPRRFWIGPPKEDQAKLAEQVQPLFFGIVEKCDVRRKSSRTGQSQSHSYRAYDDLGQPIFNVRDGSLYFDTRIDAGWAVYEYAHADIPVAV